MQSTASPKVSVVIPAYNAMAYLPEAVDSVLTQTFTDYETIVVNDGSTDHTKDWMATVADDRIRLVSQENRGLAGARNTGIREARGEYVAFLDADDIWHPTKLEKQVALMESAPAVGLVYTWMTLVDPAGEPTGRYVQNTASGQVWSSLILRNCVGSGSNPMVKKECFERLGYFDENLGSYMEDRDMWLRIAPHYEFAVVKESLVDYRQHPSSASKNWAAMARSAKIILDKAAVSAPGHISESEKTELLNKSWARINLGLAWKPLQSRAKDLEKSRSFLQTAVRYDSSLQFSKEYLRLRLTQLAIRFLGTGLHERLLAALYGLRRASAKALQHK